MRTFSFPDSGRPFLAALLRTLLCTAVILGGASRSDAQAPRILSLTPDVVVSLGGAAQLEVSAAGLDPLAYQWLRGGQRIPQATSFSLGFSNVTAAVSATYQVVVANSLGSITSSPVRISVIPVLPGSRDALFAGPPVPNDVVREVMPLAGGTTWIAGSFTQLGSVPVEYIARLRFDGTLDPGVLPSPGSGANGPIYAMTRQSDGKILIGGAFTTYGGRPASHFARLLPDGSFDSDFALGQGADDAVWAIAVQPDGRILIGGSFNTFQGNIASRLARVTAEGILDTTFATNSLPAPGEVRSILVDGPDRLFVGGFIPNYGGQAAPSLVMLDRGGLMSASFRPPFPGDGWVTALARQSGGRLLVGGRFTVPGSSLRNLARLLPDGSLDPSFPAFSSPDEQVSRIVVDKSDKILVGGGFSTFGDKPVSRLVRLTPEGFIDPLFGLGQGVDEWVESIALDTGGRIYIAGNFERVDGALRPRVARLIGGEAPPFAPVISRQPSSRDVLEGDTVRLRATGLASPLPDAQWWFGSAPIAGATSAELVLANVRMSQAGSYHVVFSNALGRVVSDAAIVRIGASADDPGSPDIGFFAGEGPDGNVFSVVPLEDGSAYVGGSFQRYNGVVNPGLVRVLPDGRVDPTFENLIVMGGAAINPNVYSLLRSRDGSLYVAGYGLGVGQGLLRPLLRLTPEGRIDPAFWPSGPPPGLGGPVVSIAEHPDRSISLAVPGFHQPVLRLTPQGDPAPGYIPPANFQLPFPVTMVASQPDGKLLVVGGIGSSYFQSPKGIVRLRNTGDVDPSFDPGSGPNSLIQSVAIQPDGRILIAGQFTRFNGRPQVRLARLNPDGSIDGSFSIGSGPDNNVETVRLLPDGRILIGGMFSLFDGVPRTRVARLHPNGGLDLSFDPLAGPNDLVRALAEGPGETLWIGGDFGRLNDLPRPRLGRLHMEEGLPFPPFILDQPHSDVVQVGMDVALDVLADGWPSPRFQWKRDGGVLAGQTNWTALLRNVRQNQQGSYSVSVENPLGLVESSRIDLVVEPAPVNAGAPDLSFFPGEGPNDAVRALVLDADGHAMIGGAFNEVDGLKLRGAARLRIDGRPDPTFNTQERMDGTVLCMLPQPGGRWLVGGTFNVVGTNSYPRLARLLPDGRVDTTFNPMQFWVPFTGGEGIHTLAALPNGQILVGGDFYAPLTSARTRIFRINGDGSLDRTYREHEVFSWIQQSGRVSVLQVLPDGGVLVGGNFTSFGGRPRVGLVRLDRDGIMDLRFSPVLSGEVRAIRTQKDGRILIGGAFQSVEGVPRAFVARLLENGRLDASFDVGRGAANQVLAIHVQPDERIVLGGTFQSFNGVPCNRIVRLLPNGSVDRTFDPGPGFMQGSSYLDEYGVPVDLTAVYAIVQQADGQLLVGGEFTQSGRLTRPFISRLNDRDRPPLLRWRIAASDGVLDLEWDNGVLQSAPEPVGPWSDLREASSPYPVEGREPHRYFRLRLR